MPLLNDFLEALRFLTILPIPSLRLRDYAGSSGGTSRAIIPSPKVASPPKKGSDPFQKGPGPFRPSSALARSMFFFPLAGLFIGAITLGVYFLFHAYLPDGISNLILLAVPIFISGGLHLDGFADFADGFGGGKNKEEILHIMKDSHIGTFGAAAIAILLLAKYQLLLEIPMKEAVFLMALASSRWVQVVLCFFLPAANPSAGLGREVAQKIGVRELTGATAFLFIITVWLQGPGLILFVGLVLFSALIGRLFYQRVGGITGDLIGAASEMTELLIYFLAIIF